MISKFVRHAFRLILISPGLACVCLACVCLTPICFIPIWAADSNNWATVRGQGINAQTRRDFVSAEKRLEYALKLTRSCKPDDPRIETSLNDLAQLYAREKKFAQARTLYLKVLKIDESRYGEDNEALIPALNNVIKVTCAGGLCYDTIPELKKLLAIREKANGPVSRDVPVTLLLIAEAYEKHQNFSDALKYFRRAVAVQKQLTGENSAMVIALNKNVDRALKEQEQQPRVASP